MNKGPSPIVALSSVLSSLLTVTRPGPFGSELMTHNALRGPLDRLAHEGTHVIGEIATDLTAYVDQLTQHDPNSLSRNESLAFWINLYNAGGLILAGRAQEAGEESVLGIPGAFGTDFVSVKGESLSLDDIEHGKLRRFRDPRIHAALVCGSISCPTLRSEPYEGSTLDVQLDDQMRYLLAAGGCTIDRVGKKIQLSRIFLWFGADFVRPHRMPAFIPATRVSVLAAISPWLDPELVAWIKAAGPSVGFLPYNWGLGCAVR